MDWIDALPTKVKELARKHTIGSRGEVGGNAVEVVGYAQDKRGYPELGVKVVHKHSGVETLGDHIIWMQESAFDSRTKYFPPEPATTTT